MSFDISLNFQNSIRAHVGHTVFATLQIKLYRIVEYDSKWSTEFHEDCMLEYIYNSLLRRLFLFSNWYSGPFRVQSLCITPN